MLLLYKVKCCLLLRSCLIASILCLSTAKAADILEAYKDAAASDPLLRQATAETQADQELKPQARALLLPDLRAGATYDRTYNFDRDAPSGPFVVDSGDKTSFDSRRYDLTLTQPVYDREALYRIREANALVNQSEADFISAQQDLVLRVAERYFNVLAALDDLTFRVADKEAIARQLEQARRRYEVGLITITDVLEAQARYDLANADEIDAQRRLADAREALREVTGRYYEQVSLLDPDAPLDPVDPDDPEAWVSIALENNPQVLSAAFGVERAQENVQVQKSGHYPTLDLRAQAAKSNEANIDTRSNNIGLELTIPLYQGGAVNARTREAAYRYEAAKEVLERVQRDVVRRTRDSYVGLETARSRVSALAQAVKSNRSGLEATQAGFDVGTRTIVDVLDSERDLLLAIRDLAVSRYDYILNRLRLLQAAGRISEKQMETISVWLRPPEKPQP